MKAMLNGMVISVSGNSNNNGSPCIMAPVQQGNKYQLWYWNNQTIINAGNQLAMCTQGRKVVVMSPQMSSNFRWSIEGNMIQSEKDDKCIDIPKSNRNAGTALIVYKGHSNLNQRFQLESLEDTQKFDTRGMTAQLFPNAKVVAYDQPLHFKSKHNNYLYLHTNAAVQDSPVVCWSSTSGSNQRFVFTKDGYIISTLDPTFVLECIPKNGGKVFMSKKRFSATNNPCDPLIGAQKFNVFADGKYKYIASAFNSNLVMQMSGAGNFGKGDAIIMNPRNETNNGPQCFLFESAPSSISVQPVTWDQSCYITHKKSGLYCDVEAPIRAGQVCKLKKGNLMTTSSQTFIFKEDGFICSGSDQNYVLSAARGQIGETLTFQPKLQMNNLHQKWLVSRNKKILGSIVIESALNPNAIVGQAGKEHPLKLDSAQWKDQHSFAIRSKSTSIF